MLFNDERHSRTQSFELGDRTGLHLESLAVVVAIILGCLPGSVGSLVFQVVNLHLDFLVEGRNESGELIALVQSLEMILADIEGPHISLMIEMLMIGEPSPTSSPTLG